MRKTGLCLLLIILLHPESYSQEPQTFPVIISISNNASLMPGKGYLGIFTVPVHPGGSIGTRITLKDWEKSSLYESFMFGGYYHKYSQLAFELYSELIYQQRFGAFALEPQFQAGYMMAISDLNEFTLDGEVYREDKFTGRSRFVTGVGFGISWTFNRGSEVPVKVNLAYLVNLQMPFVKNYAPVLIVTSLQAGAVFSIPCKNMQSGTVSR